MSKILEFIRDVFFSPPKPPAGRFGTVTEVREVKGGYRLIVDATDSIQYSVLMPRLHPYAGVILPKPDLGTRAYIEPMEHLASRPMSLCSLEVGEHWLKFPYFPGR